MTSIKAYAPQEKAIETPLHEASPKRDNAKEALRYSEEAEAPGINKWEKWSKLDTASVLSQLALEDIVQEYSGKKKPTPR
jgi:hypothetical protein